VRAFEYDGEDRIVRIVFPEAVQLRSYDAMGRLARLEEGSTSVEYAYDDLDRRIRETQSAGGIVNRIDYQYDNLDRVVRRTVNGGDAVSYAYDKAGRVTRIAYRDQATSYEWDAANRMAVKVLPNGIRQEFQYDDADRMTGITYHKSDQSVIEEIVYAYDAAGQVISRRLSQASIVETPFTATYDAVNRMTSVTLTATNATYNLTYDDNGNLTRKQNAAQPSDVTTYAWDTRDRLARIDAPGVSATFAYDALNRRSERIVNGESTRYVYDGTQAIAEVRGSRVDSLLTGLTIDEAIAVYTDAGASTYLTDALNTVIAQTKEDQSVQNFYAYTPYGEVVAVGPDEGNSLQYTGRENDRTGLFYYRARYYDPVLKRFLTEDPAGLDGGLNLYAYGDDNPLSYVDATGETPAHVVAAILVALREAIKRCARNPKCRCQAVYTAYKAACGIGCQGTTCAVVTAQVAAAALCYNLRMGYVRMGCDKVFPTRRDHPGAAAQAKRAWDNCEKKRQRVCKCE
jgi:RHS repeat-associated protein